VGFRTPADAWAQLEQAGWLWHYHFGWVGMAAMAAGLFWLWRARQYRILLPTLLYALAQQSFNLFYNIGDILVYYIPLYLVGSLWAGFALAGLMTGDWRMGEARMVIPRVGPAGWLAGGALLLLALRIVPVTSAQIDQSGANEARQQWEAILAAAPPTDAILVSNDRNEIVPLFYLQAVEGHGNGLTGLFPLIAPDARFADIGATLTTAMETGGTQRVYLIKAMPGLEVRFDLQPATPPLVEVVGTVATTPTVSVDEGYGPLRLLGYDLVVEGMQADVVLYWQVVEPVGDDLVATAQLLTDADRKLGQDDHAPGGDYYPTSLWKVGEQVVVRHRLALSEAWPGEARLLVGFYRPADVAMLAQPLVIPLDISEQ
jgi:hypothetical protein